MGRLWVALTAFALLIGGVVWGQGGLSRVSGELAEKADRVCDALSEKSTEEEGLKLLDELIEDFASRRPFLGIFVNDARIHEIQRALSRARQLGSQGEVSPALEALVDLSKTLKELSETHSPYWENILYVSRLF